MEMEQLYDVIVIGGGPAGLTAALYLARARYRVLVVEKEHFGGQITITNEIVNYPGVAKTSGRELTDTMRQQAEGFGAEFLLAEVTALELDGDVKTVKTGRGEYRCFGVLLATGAHPRMIGFPGEAEFRERHSFCFRFQPVDKRALNSIALDAQAEGIPLWDRDISRYVYSNRVPVYNPLEDFLFNLPEWDGRDRIRPLAQTVPCNNPHWPELFHRWFLNMVAHWRGMDKRYANSVSPLLVGAQGTRKSTFCRSIMPPSECSYYTDSLDFSRKKDVELSLNRFALINIDEFDQVSATQQRFLKHILQKPVVNARRPYGTSVVEMRRYASFIATSNHKDLLTDPSGSRRFICIEVKGVIDTSRPIDYDQLYAQAMHELAHGERYWFNDADEYVMTEANREFQQYSPEEQFLFRYFRMAEAGEEGEWMAPAEILKILHQEVDIPLNAKRVAAFGRILRKQGIPSRHTRKGTVYQLVRA